MWCIDNGASKSEAFPTDPTGSSSLVKFDVVSPIDAVTGETWNPIATAGAVPAPVTDPNAPAEWGLTKSVDLSLGGHYYSKGSSFDIGVGGALIIWAHFEYGTMSATVYEGTTTGGLQWGIEASSHGVLATASTIIPGADNESRGSFGNFPAGYHRVALIALAEGKIKLEIDGEPFGNVLNFNSNLIFDQIGGDHRVNYGDSGISIFAMQVIEDPNFGTEARVVSTDLVNNTMTVDGGDWLGSDGTGETGGDTQVTFGPVTGTGKLGSTDGTTVEITDSNGRWIDWTNYNSGVEYTDTYSPQQFAVKSTAAPFLDANNPDHVTLFNNIKTSFTNYSNNYVAPPTKYFVDNEDHQLYTQYQLQEKFGVNAATDRFLELSNPHPEYAIKEIVRFKNHYRVVHNLTSEFKLISDEIQSRQNP